MSNEHKRNTYERTTWRPASAHARGWAVVAYHLDGAVGSVVHELVLPHHARRRVVPIHEEGVPRVALAELERERWRVSVGGLGRGFLAFGKGMTGEGHDI
mgnify:CR=1 FL=1